MSALLEILTAGSGGGVFGMIGAIGKGWLDLKHKKLEIEEKKAVAEIERDKIKLLTDKATIEGEAASFTASQQAAIEDAKNVKGIATLAQSTGQRWLLLCVETLRSLTRPLLTWFAHGALLYVYFTADAETQRMIILSVSGMAGTYGGWWFGSRPVVRFSEQLKK